MIGERLAEIRKDHGNTQASLAEQLGVSLPTVRAWEQEKSSPSHEMLIAICQLYQVSSDYLLGLSNIDPVYMRNRRMSRFTEGQLSEIRNFEAYILWRDEHLASEEPR